MKTETKIQRATEAMELFIAQNESLEDHLYERAAQTIADRFQLAWSWSSWGGIEFAAKESRKAIARLIVWDHDQDTGAKSVVDICERPVSLRRDGRMIAKDAKWWAGFTVCYDAPFSMSMELIPESTFVTELQS